MFRACVWCVWWIVYGCGKWRAHCTHRQQIRASVVLIERETIHTHAGQKKCVYILCESIAARFMWMAKRLMRTNCSTNTKRIIPAAQWLFWILYYSIAVGVRVMGIHLTNFQHNKAKLHRAESLTHTHTHTHMKSNQDLSVNKSLINERLNATPTSASCCWCDTVNVAIWQRYTPHDVHQWQASANTHSTHTHTQRPFICVQRKYYYNARVLLFQSTSIYLIRSDSIRKSASYTICDAYTMLCEWRRNEYTRVWIDE